MNKQFKQALRAAYQIIVVGIILLPMRLLVLLWGLLLGLMAPSSGSTILEYYEEYFAAIKISWKRRALWVKYGYEMYDLEASEEDESN